MKFIGNEFMLHGETAKKLYFDYAEKLPIIDYHCHLSPLEIAENHSFANITELMLGGDHYKWRFMRSGGIDEKYITGDGEPREKFRRWASVLPYGIGNPLYHWTHLELLRYFGIDEALCAENADEIYDECGKLLAREDFRARALIAKSNVKVVCTTDDPLSDLSYHGEIAGSGFGTRVLPAFRPDKAISIDDPGFCDYIKDYNAASYGELVNVLLGKIAFFHEKGSRLADHGFSVLPNLNGKDYSEAAAAAAYEKRMNGGTLTTDEVENYRFGLCVELAREYARRGWVMQLHMGATRNNNTAMKKKLGPDAGFDGMSDMELVAPLTRLLDTLDKDDLLPKTILYTLNPVNNYTLGVMLGNFQKGPTFGKLQLGSGWWFCDQRDGMESQLKALANLGMLGTFVGMLTDSRSFVSYPRHEYFRRILCNLIGGWVDDGEYPADYNALGKIISGISYENAEKYFNF